MPLDVSVPQRHLKVLANAITCLGKIGKDMVLEADAHHLILRALNDSKSAFAAFYFQRDAFFDEFLGGEEDGTSTTCKVSLKAMQLILKSLKRVTTLRLYLEDTDVEPHLVFDMQCEGGFLKRHHVQLQDCEIVHAVFHREGASSFSTQASQLLQLMEHLHGSHEIALHASKDHVWIKSFHSDSPAGVAVVGDAPGSASISTVVSINATDFDNYSFEGRGRPLHVEEDEDDEERVALVVSSRDLKAVLTFCESSDCSYVSMYFHCGGRPVLLSAEETWVTVELVLATVEPTLVGEEERMPTPKPKKTKARRSGGNGGVRGGVQEEEDGHRNGEGEVGDRGDEEGEFQADAGMGDDGEENFGGGEADFVARGRGGSSQASSLRSSQAVAVLAGMRGRHEEGEEEEQDEDDAN